MQLPRPKVERIHGNRSLRFHASRFTHQTGRFKTGKRGNHPIQPFSERRQIFTLRGCANITRKNTMNRVLKTVVIGLAGLLAAVANNQAQVQQSINIDLTISNQDGDGIRPIHIRNKDIITNLVGTNVPGGKLLLVMATDPVPGDGNNIGAFLRVTDSHGTIVAETTTDSFNIYQGTSSHTATRIIAYENFSFDIGNFGAEIYGQGTWTKSASRAGGQGSFRCNLAGICFLTGITDSYQPCAGSITGASPKPARD
jgi:hypothetical protein